MSSPDYDVAIVGYGPVGQTAAILMGRLGYRVGVFERWPSLYPRACWSRRTIGLRTASLRAILMASSRSCWNSPALPQAQSRGA